MRRKESQKRTLMIFALVAFAALLARHAASKAFAGDPIIDPIIKLLNPAYVPCCEDDAAVSKCLSAICSSPEEKETFHSIYKEIDEKAEKRIHDDLKKIGNSLVSWLEATAGLESSYLNQLQKIIAENKTNIEPEFQTMNNVELLLAHFWEAEFDIRSKHGNIVIDRQKTKARLVHLPEADQDWMIEALQRAYELPLVEDGIDISVGSESPAWIFQRRYPGLSLADAAKKMAQSAKKQLDRFYDKVYRPLGLPKSLISTWLPSDLIEAIASGKRLDPASLSRFIMATTDIALYLELLENPSKYPWLSKRKPVSVAPLLKSAKIRENVQATRAILGQRGIEKEFVEQLVIKCLISYSANMIALPSTQEVEAIRTKVDEVKASISRNVLPFFSKETREKLSDVIKNTEVTPPMTKSDYAGDFLEALRLATVQAIASRDWALRSARTKAAQQLILATAAQFSTRDFNPLVYLEDKYDFCRDFGLQHNGDFARPGSASVSLSWESIKMRTQLAPSLAHEFGHVIQFFFEKSQASSESTRRYEIATDCLARKHDPPSPRYVIEDFADFVMSKAVGGTANPNCSFWNRSGNEAFRLERDSKDNKETHSTSLFRILHTEKLLNGTLPAGCENIGKSRRTPLDFSSCL